MSNDYNGKKRSELPDNVFGIPQERKYPMPDEKHTRSAIKLFNHVEPKYEEQLAKAIIKNMKKYNIDGSVVGPNNRLRKYLPKDMIKEYVEEACKDLTHARKLCNAVRKLARKYNANYFFVTDGASSYSNGNGKYNTAAKEMRDHMDDWERNNGFNPDDDWTNDINNVSNYRLLKESSIPEEIPKNIRELLRRLNSYDYGYIKNGQKIKETKNFFEDYKSLTISEFEKYQIGVCWDYVHYEAYWFAKNHYKYETFYIQVQDEDNDCPSHTYLVFYLPNSSKVYYFESSWGKYQGIEAFDNINKLHNTIKERHIESARSKCDPKTYFRNKYDAKSSRWEHLSCGDYMVKVSNGKVKINESVSSTVSKDHKQKGYIKLSSLKKIRITETIINKYKKEYPVLRHVRCKDTDEYVCDGYMWFKDDDLVCYVGSCQYTDDKTKWIVSLEILPKYRGYGLSNQILDFCVKSMNCKYLSVNKNNELAKKIYDKYGFKVYHEDKTMYYMTLDTISPKNESGGYIYSFERSPIQEYDYIPESGVLSVIKPIPTKDKNKIKYIMEDLGDDFKDFVFANICFYDIEEYEKTPIGFVILRKKPELHTAFVSIGVSEQHRNSGVGSKLLQKAISYFKSTKDLMWLEYWVNIDNKASIALAEKSGFVKYLSGDTAKALGYYHYHMKNNNNLYERIEKSSSRKITTVVFDLGDVLIKSNMQNKLKKNPRIPNQQIYPLLEKWFDDDLDLLSKDEYIDIISKRLSPDFSDIVPDIVDAFSDIEVLPYTIPTLKDLREKGYRIYYLSNWSRWGVEILGEKNKLEFLSLFDGGLFSYEVGVKKPDRKIYDTFIKKFKINPKEAMFFDDKERNIEAANKLGIHGVLFDKHDSAIIYNALDDMYRKNVLSEFTLPFGGKINMNKLAKELIEDIKPVIFTSKNKQQASKLGLTLKCELETIDRNTICIVVLDGPQDKRDTKEARLLLSNIQIDCKSKLYGYVSKVTIGDSDEGCLYLTVNKKYIQKSRKDLLESAVSSIPESFIINENNEDPMYFYHLVNKNVNMSKGLLSLGYMYNHDRNMFRKNSAKYRERLCEGWGIYTGRDPDSLTDEEVFDGLKRFRGVDNLNSIYFFKFPPYESLDKEFKRIYKSKEIYRININDPKTKSLIKNIDYGFVDSCTDNDRLNRNWYDNVSIDDYFSNFDKSKGLLFSTLYHISIEFKKGICPAYCLEKVKTPNTIDDIRQLESSIQEYGTTAGTMVGTNQPDSVYIVNYMQNNAFSGHKEPKFGVCRKGMKDLHIVGGKYNRFHYVSDLDKFKEEASDIHVYRFKGKPKNEFFDIIEEMKDDNDLDLYKLITGREIKDRSEIRFDGDFIEEECFFDTIDAIKACTEAGLLEASTDLHPVPILTETVQGRPYNYYRDLNGVFIQHEITGLRSKSYETLDDIPEAEKDIVKRGYLV